MYDKSIFTKKKKTCKGSLLNLMDISQWVDIIYTAENAALLAVVITSSLSKNYRFITNSPQKVSIRPHQKAPRYLICMIQSPFAKKTYIKMLITASKFLLNQNQFSLNEYKQAFLLLPIIFYNSVTLLTFKISQSLIV